MKPTQRHLIALAAAGVIACTLPASGLAQGTGFEPGDPSVTSTGDAGTEQTFQGVAPPQGANQYLLTTINEIGVDGTDGFANQSGSNAVATPQLDVFFGNEVTINGTEGSAFRLNNIVVTAANNIITFRYDFLTSELPPFPGDPNPGGDPLGHLDYAFAILLDGNGAIVGSMMIFASPTDINYNLPSSQLAGGNPFGFHTGYQTFSLSVATPGTYSLGIGVVDRTTSDSPSGLLVDAVAVIPEPTTFALAFVGLALAGLLHFRRARRA